MAVNSEISNKDFIIKLARNLFFMTIGAIIAGLSLFHI